MQVLEERIPPPSRREKLPFHMDLNKAVVQTTFSPPPNMPQNNRFQLSPDLKKANSPSLNGQQSPRKTKESKLDNFLFTIEENHYFRKNTNNISPRPPKFRSPTQRTSFFPDSEISDTSREKKVAFTETLIADRPPIVKKQCSSQRSIMRSGSLTSKQNQDNLSASSISMRSISVQNSFVSQLKTSTIDPKSRPRIDKNKQKYSQIMSYFQSTKSNKTNGDRQKLKKGGKPQQLQKYTDSIFPPVHTSLFLVIREKKVTSQIKWKRLSDFSPKLNPVLKSKEEEISFICSNVFDIASETKFLAIAFNALKFCSCILERMLEDQSYNDYGLYLVKIFQQNNWKSIILDDFIPVKTREVKGVQVETPIFLQVRPQTKCLEIWPYLVLKAFANYYAAYEMILYGNLIDFLNQLTGIVPVEVLRKKKIEKQLNKLKNLVEMKDSFAIGELMDPHRYYIIRNRIIDGNNYLVYSEYPSFREAGLDASIFQGLKKYYYYSPRTYHTLSAATIGRYHPGHKIQERAQYSLRKLIVEQNCECLISLQQKQSRFFCKSSINYSYMWLRTILVQREYNGYRWIGGNYTNNKSTVLSVSLAPGEYYLIIMPEWKTNHNYELTLLVWANHIISIEREKGNSCQEMIELACMDLAQRKGSISQLKSNICSYNYICPNTGMIIENINNQKLKEDVKIHRRISGIPCSVELLPLNRVFWQSKDKYKEQIEIDIPKLSAFTIVLKMRGGIDTKLVKLFASEKDK